MPITSSAKKALRRDIHRTQVNRKIRSQMKSVLDAVKANPDTKTVSQAYAVLDRAAKKNIIHKNKAARLKSQASQYRAPKSLPKKEPAKTKSSSSKKVKK